MESPYNTGKTKTLKYIALDLIKNIPDVSILSITANDYITQKQLTYYGIHNENKHQFIEFSENPKKSKKYVVSTIHKVIKSTKKYDIILIDDLFLVMKFINDKELKKLNKLISNAKAIICTDVTYKYYSIFKNIKLYHYKNEFEYKTNIIKNNIKNYDEFIINIKNKCEESKQMIIIFENNEELKKVENKILNLNSIDDYYFFVMNTIELYSDHIIKNKIPRDSCIVTTVDIAMQLLSNLNYENVYIISNKNTEYLLLKPSPEINLFIIN